MAAFRKQLLALANCHMILGVPTEDGPKTIKAAPVETFNAWLADEDGQHVAWLGVLDDRPPPDILRVLSRRSRSGGNG